MMCTKLVCVTPNLPLNGLYYKFLSCDVATTYIVGVLWLITYVLSVVILLLKLWINIRIM